ncbi:MAG: beta strand repeat-containing protein, partial [Nostoc sp.]
SNLEITFEGVSGRQVILQNFALENLENLSKSTGATVDSGNILFYGQTSTTDSFDVFNANSLQSTIFNKNTVTFLNDLSNNVSGFDNSDDVINGQGGDDKIDGKSGNDLLRGGTGNDSLFGGSGGNDTIIGGSGDDYLNAGGDESILGDDSILYGGTGNDNLSVFNSSADNLLYGGDGNDTLNASGEYYGFGSGNNTLYGGAGDDYLTAFFATGNNILDGGDGNDYLSISASYDDFGYYSASGDNTLNGGAGNDILNTAYTQGDNLLLGGDGNDSFYVGSIPFYPPSGFVVTQTLDGGIGDDFLSVDDRPATAGITTTFNATTNIGSITAGRSLINYKNIERLNILGTVYDDLIVGNSGNDTLSTGNGGNDTIDGGIGDDLLSVDYSNTTAGITTTFNATTNIGSLTAGTSLVSYKNIERLNILGTVYDDLIVGNSGNDTLSTGNGGNDTIDGGIGDDLLTVDYSNTTAGITTTFNASTNIGSITAGTSLVSYKNIERLNILGTVYDDNIVGNSGNDTLSTGNGGNDTIDGGLGEDLLLYANYTTEVGITTTFNATTNIGSVTAGTSLISYKNIEQLNISGTAYDDLIVGSNGNDTLSGGYSGNDTLYGGAGTDTFAFDSYNQGINTIYDFNATNELIQVSAYYFYLGLSLGPLKASQFTIGTSATTTNQRFIYNSATGGLFFDFDGSASGFTQVQFAQLSTGLSLTNSNFVVG